jgi:hypothetical protein
MANILDLAKKMGIDTASTETGKASVSTKRRPWLEPESKEEKESENFKARDSKKEALENSEKRWKKLEDRTDRHMARQEAKAEKQNTNPGTSQVQPNDNPGTARVQNKRTASYTTLQCLPMRLVPRKILDHIKANAFQSEGDWFSRVDSFEIQDSLQKDSNHLRKAISRLKDEGWFEVIEASSSGYRLLKIDPKNFGLEK